MWYFVCINDILFSFNSFTLISLQYFSLSTYISCGHFFPQENDENSTLLHRDDVPAIDLGP